MKNWLKTAVFAAILGIAGCGPQTSTAAKPDALNAAYERIRGEHEIQRLLLELSESHPAADYLIEDVRVVDVAAGVVHDDYAIEVRDGRFAWVGPNEDAPDDAGLARIDGAGRYATPALADMHVHTMATDRDFLLQLLNGVTTIREMDGFPYHFGRRALAERDAYLIPNHSVTSIILNSNDFGGFALAVNTPEEARAAVHEQFEIGADAIKVHNGLANDVYHAIAEAAAEVLLPLVGHIPVRVTIAESIAAGQLTNEHFKGYIKDDTLQLTDEDYVAVTDGSGLWNTPTFVTYLSHLRGAEAHAVLARPEFALISRQERAAWEALADSEVDGITRLRQNIRVLSEQIFRELLDTDARFLAGTDSGGYEFMLAGYALQEELRIMESLGLSPLETLRTATTNAEEVLGWQGRTGEIAERYSADLLLTAGNPLETVGNLARPSGVMLRGRYLDERALAGIFDSIRSIYAQPAPDLSEDELRLALRSLYEETRARAEAGFVYRSEDLAARAALAGDLGETELTAGLVGRGLVFGRR